MQIYIGAGVYCSRAVNICPFLKGEKGTDSSAAASETQLQGKSLLLSPLTPILMG